MIIQNLFRATDGKIFDNYKSAWMYEFNKPYTLVRMYNRDGSYVYDPADAVSFVVMGRWAAEFVQEYLQHEKNLYAWLWSEGGPETTPSFNKWVWMVAKDYDNPNLYGPHYRCYEKGSNEAKMQLYADEYSKNSELYKFLTE